MMTGAMNQVLAEQRSGEGWPPVEKQNLTDEFKLPVEMTFHDGHVVAIVVYSILFVLSSIGNITVLIFLVKRRRKTPSRIDAMLMHLAIADLLVTILLMPLEIGWHATVAWYAGDLVCRIMSYFRTFGLYLSSFILVCISIDRYIAVLRPLNSYGMDTRSRLMIMTAWFAAMVCSVPQAIIFHVDTHPNVTTYEQCVTFNFFNDPSHQIMYTITTQVLMYVVPLIVIIFSYGSIYIEIFEKTKISNCERLRRSSVQFLGRAKQRTLKMTITIVIAFVVCWTPYHVITTWYMFDHDKAKDVDQKVQHALFLFACTNSVVNPVVYGVYNIRRRTTPKHMSLMHSSTKRSQEFVKSDSRRTMISEVKEII